MNTWEATDDLESNVESIGKELTILTPEGAVEPDPEELDEEYFNKVRVRVRSFLILCSSELEEFIETQCLEYLGRWARSDNGPVHHNCIHALTIHFRNKIGKFLEQKGSFIDFYASTEQAHKIAGERKKAASDENPEPPILNRKTLVAKVSIWYRDDVVALSHGISEQGLIRLLEPLGFSTALVRDECPNLLSALGGLAAGRGEAAHRSARAGKYPYTSLPAPIHTQMSVSDAWGRWTNVRDSLHELRDLLDRASKETPDVADNSATA